MGDREVIDLYALQYESSQLGWIKVRTAKTLDELQVKKDQLVASHPDVFHEDTKWRVLRRDLLKKRYLLCQEVLA